MFTSGYFFSNKNAGRYLYTSRSSVISFSAGASAEVSDLISILSPRKTGISENSFEKSGLVKRVPSSTDGRYKEIVLTKKAERFKEYVYRDMQNLEEQIVSGISPEQLEIWRGVTEKMIGNLCK